MLPGLGFSELLVLGNLALLVLGPKDLPLLLRKLGRWMAQMRGMAQEFRTGFDELARQAELDELKKEVEALRNITTRGVSGFVDELSRPVDMTPIPPRPLPAPGPEPYGPTEPAALPAPTYAEGALEGPAPAQAELPLGPQSPLPAAEGRLP